MLDQFVAYMTHTNCESFPAIISFTLSDIYRILPKNNNNEFVSVQPIKEYNKMNPNTKAFQTDTLDRTPKNKLTFY